MNKTFAPTDFIRLLSARLYHLRTAFSFFTLVCSGLYCYGQLPTDLDLPSETLDSGYLVFQASNSITNSGSNFSVQDPASVTLTAGSSITLEPGFDAVATSGTSTFQAVINPNVVNWQPIPVPSPPTACTDCGLEYAVGSSGASPQATYAPSTIYGSALGNFPYALCWGDLAETYTVACNVALSTGYYPNSNGHYHGSPPPPVSSIAPSSGYTGDYATYVGDQVIYEMPVTLTTKQVGQIETIYITLTNCPEGVTCNDGKYDYAVGYPGLVYIGNSSIFAQIGATAIHGGSNYWNHWMTGNSSRQLQQAATAYINNNSPGQKICINDMGLPLGGKFDLNANWNSPHNAHDWGTAADVAVKSVACSAISGNYLVNSGLYKSQCLSNGPAIEVLLECTDAATGKTRQPCSQCLSTDKSCHVHCRWPN